MKTARSVNLIAPGSTVMIGTNEKIEATVSSIAIGANNRVLYECVWWSGRTRNEQWLEECEVKIRPSDYQHLQVGFGSIDEPT